MRAWQFGHLIALPAHSGLARTFVPQASHANTAPTGAAAGDVFDAAGFGAAAGASAPGIVKTVAQPGHFVRLPTISGLARNPRPHEVHLNAIDISLILSHPWPRHFIPGDDIIETKAGFRKNKLRKTFG